MSYNNDYVEIEFIISLNETVIVAMPMRNVPLENESMGTLRLNENGRYEFSPKVDWVACFISKFGTNDNNTDIEFSVQCILTKSRKEIGELFGILENVNTCIMYLIYGALCTNKLSDINLFGNIYDHACGKKIIYLDTNALSTFAGIHKRYMQNVARHIKSSLQLDYIDAKNPMTIEIDSENAMKSTVCVKTILGDDSRTLDAQHVIVEFIKVASIAHPTIKETINKIFDRYSFDILSIDDIIRLNGGEFSIVIDKNSSIHAHISRLEKVAIDVNICGKCNYIRVSDIVKMIIELATYTVNDIPEEYNINRFKAIANVLNIDENIFIRKIMPSDKLSTGLTTKDYNYIYSLILNKIVCDIKRLYNSLYYNRQIESISDGDNRAFNIEQSYFTDEFDSSDPMLVISDCRCKHNICRTVNEVMHIDIPLLIIRQYNIYKGIQNRNNTSALYHQVAPYQVVINAFLQEFDKYINKK